MAFFKSDKDLEKRILISARLRSTLEMLKDMNARLLDIQERIDTIEQVLGNRLPPDILTERTFKEEVRVGDDIIGEIISKVEEISTVKSVEAAHATAPPIALEPARPIEDAIESQLEQKFSLTENKRIESITGLLQQHGRLSSSDLAKHMGLSRTRCNEYFKQMEEMGVVKPVLEGRKKFYKLS